MLFSFRRSRWLSWALRSSFLLWRGCQSASEPGTSSSPFSHSLGPQLTAADEDDVNRSFFQLILLRPLTPSAEFGLLISRRFSCVDQRVENNRGVRDRVIAEEAAWWKQFESRGLNWWDLLRLKVCIRPSLSLSLAPPLSHSLPPWLNRSGPPQRKWALPPPPPAIQTLMYVHSCVCGVWHLTEVRYCIGTQ